MYESCEQEVEILNPEEQETLLFITYNLGKLIQTVSQIKVVNQKQPMIAVFTHVLCH